ncbi:hypothetical protein [Nocardiopsis ansamitocini]|nr:hypothetical protein [Nocardiopsis ansamitocini]
MTAETAGATVIRRMPEPRGARLVTDGLDPKTWLVAASVLVGWGTSGLVGVGWALAALCFAGVLPVLLIKLRVRSGAWSDRHLGVRRQRLMAMAMIVASVTCGAALMAALGAPVPMVALLVAIGAVLTLLGAITFVWKISVHTAASSGSVVMLVLVYGVWALLAAPLVVLVGWSRVALRDHTAAQTVAGAVVGSTAAWVVFSLVF